MVIKNISRIHWKHDTAKEHLDEKEIRRLERVEFTEYPDVQRACLLAIYTGLRQSDILALDWKSVHINSKKRSYLDIIIHKTQVAVKLPLSPAAIELLSKPKKRGLVFPDLTGYKLGFYISRLLKLAKIEKYITFHSARHSISSFALKTNGLQNFNLRQVTIWKRAKFPYLSYSALLKRTLNFDCKSSENIQVSNSQ